MPMPGLAADEDERPGHETATEDPVEFIDAEAQPRHVRVGDGGEAGRGRADARARHGIRAPRAGSWTTVSTRLFH